MIRFKSEYRLTNPFVRSIMRAKRYRPAHANCVPG